MTELDNFLDHMTDLEHKQGGGLTIGEVSIAKRAWAEATRIAAEAAKSHTAQAAMTDEHLPEGLFRQPEMYAIAHKWINYAKTDFDTNDISVTVWAAIHEARNFEIARTEQAQAERIKELEKDAARLEFIKDRVNTAVGTDWLFEKMNNSENSKVFIATIDAAIERMQGEGK